MLNETSAEDFNHDISVADDLLAPWISKAPLRAFQHPLEQWGSTEEKRVAVNAHLDRLAYRSAGVTSWFYEWEWDRAWRHLLQTGRTEEAESLKAAFVDYAAAQVAHDAETCRTVFGHEVIGIGLIHPVAFFTEVADAFFARLLAEGVTFVPLSEALDDPAYLRSGVLQPVGAKSGGGVTEAEKHLDNAGDLFRQTEPPLYGLLQCVEATASQLKS